jgi:hypothetical protein
VGEDSAAAPTTAPAAAPTAATTASDEPVVSIAAQQPSHVSHPGVSLKERQAIAMWPTSDKIWHGDMDYPQSWLLAVEWVQRPEDDPLSVFATSPTSTDG